MKTTNSQNIQLPAPVKVGGKSLMECLTLRQSNRSFSDKQVDNQTLSNLLWAAYGFNREGMRTAASARNNQEIDLYVLSREGVYLYDAASNSLILKVSGDQRRAVGFQDFVLEAAMNFIYVSNTDKASSRESGFIDSGLIMQNVYLFCASEALGCITRTYFDAKMLHEDMKLTETQEITATQVVGYSK